jgi:hypothetical protein
MHRLPLILAFQPDFLPPEIRRKFPSWLAVIVVLVAFVLGGSGCATFPPVVGPITGEKYNVEYRWWAGYDYPDAFYQEVREAYVHNHPDLPKGTKDAILNKQIRPGMTDEQVKISWGAPRYIDSRITASWGYSEIWHYPGKGVWMSNGKVETIQHVTF